MCHNLATKRAQCCTARRRTALGLVQRRSLVVSSNCKRRALPLNQSFFTHPFTASFWPLASEFKAPSVSLTLLAPTDLGHRLQLCQSSAPVPNASKRSWRTSAWTHPATALPGRRETTSMSGFRPSWAHQVSAPPAGPSKLHRERRRHDPLDELPPSPDCPVLLPQARHTLEVSIFLTSISRQTIPSSLPRCPDMGVAQAARRGLHSGIAQPVAQHLRPSCWQSLFSQNKQGMEPCVHGLALAA